MDFATSAMTNLHWNARRSPRSRRRILPYVLMAVPFATNISYVDFSVRPLTRVRGSMHRSDPVLTRNSIFVARSVTKRRLVLGPSLFAAVSVGSLPFLDWKLHGGRHFTASLQNRWWYQQWPRTAGDLDLLLEFAPSP